MLEASNNNELPPIPGKRYFTIGEVSALCDVKPHVLRYWEQEFPQLKPMKRILDVVDPSRAWLSAHISEWAVMGGGKLCEVTSRSLGTRFRRPHVDRGIR